MKLITLSFLILSSTMIVNLLEVKKTSKAAEKAEKKAENKGKNFPGFNPVPDSVAYGYATNDNYPLQDMAVRK